MKKLILFLSLLLATAVVSAQSELPSDDRTPRAPEENYKEFGGFLLDMGLMSVMPPHLPKVDLSLSDTGKDFNQLFRLNPDVTYSQGLSNVLPLLSPDSADLVSALHKTCKWDHSN